jgi:hypothetical protein
MNLNKASNNAINRQPDLIIWLTTLHEEEEFKSEWPKVFWAGGMSEKDEWFLRGKHETR